MCFNKKREQEKKDDFFRYICDEFFKKDNPRDELEYEEIINKAALELMPSLDDFLSKEKDFTPKEVCEICREIAIKTCILMRLQADKNDHYLNIIMDEYSEEYNRMIADKELISLPADAIIKE